MTYPELILRRVYVAIMGAGALVSVDEPVYEALAAVSRFQNLQPAHERQAR